MNKNTIKTIFALKAMTGKVRIVLLTMAMAVVVFAASSVAFAGEVSYEGQADGFVLSPGSSSSPTDLFTNFNNVVPGDTLTDTVDVVNNGDQEARLYMRAMGGYEGNDFLSQMNLKVTQRGGNDLFDAPADQMDGLEEWVLLGDMSPGAKATLDLQLTVPLEMDNEYQDALGKLGWEFKVEEMGEPVPSPTTPTDSWDEGGKSGKKTATGDVSPIRIVIALMIAAAAAAIIIFLRRRDKKQQ